MCYKHLKAHLTLIQFQSSWNWNSIPPFIPFSQDYQTWLDLRELETKLGGRYITHESDDSRWQMFAREHTLPYPAHLVPPPPAPASDDEEGDADVQGLTERVSILWPERERERERKRERWRTRERGRGRGGWEEPERDIKLIIWDLKE